MTKHIPAPPIELNKLQVSCSSCSLASLCLPYGLDNTELQTLENIIQHKPVLEKNDIQYHAGDKQQAIYAVRSGAFKTIMTTSDGAEQITGFYLPGELLGLDGLGNGIYQCTATALETSSLCELRIEKFDDIFQNIRGLRTQLLHLIGEEISSDHQKLLAMGQLKGEERIATFLLSLGNRFAKRGFSPRIFNLPMPRHDLANYLGLAVETLSRMLSHLQKEGVISVKQRNITITDMNAIRVLAHCERLDEKKQQN